MTDWPGAPEPAEEQWPGAPEQDSAVPQPVMDRAVTYANSPAEALVAKQDHEGIMEGFGQGFREGWGPERLGMSDESLTWLQKVGVFRKSGDEFAPFKAFNETLGLAAANVLDAGTRLPGAVYRGLQTAGINAGLHRDIVSLPEAFFGSPHPIGVPKPLAEPKPFVRPVEIKPIDGSPNPGVARTVAAKTGDPLIDAILDHPTLKQVIENPVVDDSHTVPNSLGGSEPMENPTLYRDKDFPKTMTVDGVTFDTAEPSAIHENVEEFVIEALTKAGMDQATALKVGFWEFGEPAEDAWYRAHGMDPAKVEEKYTKHLDEIASRRVVTGFHGTEADITEPSTAFGGSRGGVPDERGTVFFSTTDKLAGTYGKNVIKRSIDLGKTAEFDAAELIHDPKFIEEMKASFERTATRTDALKERARTPEGRAVIERGWQNVLSKIEEWKQRGHVRYDPSLSGAIIERARSQGLDTATIKNMAEGHGKASDQIVVLNDKNHVPPDLFKGTYPDGDPAKAGPGLIDKPTPEEVARGREIMAQHLAEEASKNTVDLTEARGLGVVGPEPEPITGTPAERAEKAISRPALQPRDEAKTQEVGGAADRWRQRFDQSVGKLKAPDDVKQLIKDAADAQEDFPAARRGDVPLQHVEQIAQAAGVDPASVDPRGLGRLFKTDLEVRLAYQLMLKATDNVLEAARNHKAEPTETSRIALQEALMRRDMAVEQVVGFRAEWGRVGNTIQEFMERVKNQEQLGDFLNEQGRGRSPKDLDRIADLVDATDRNGGNVPGFLNDARKPGFADKVFWYWQNQLISGWLTHTKYAAANATYLAWNRGVVTPLARMMDVRSLGDVGHIPLEALSGIAGSISATPMAFMSAIRSVKTGLRVPIEGETELARLATERGEPIPKFAAKPFTPSQRPISGAPGRIIGIPGDAANAIHTFFRIIGYEGEMQAQAYRAAQLEGHNPLTPTFWDRQAQIRANATEDMMHQGIDVANKGTFIQESGPKAKAFQRFVRETPGLRWVFPFTHIPLNLMKATVEGTPAPLVAALFKDSELGAEIRGDHGADVQHTAIARMVAGSALMGWFVNKALNGEATGDYPNDPKDRDTWKLQGKQPNSILIGGEWHSFNKFGPIGDLAGVGASLGQAIPHLKSEDNDEMEKATWYLAQAAGRIVTDEVGMMSLQMMFEALKDDKKATTFLSSYAGSFLPASSFLGQTASIMDPSMRQAKTIVDGLKYRIPVERETLLPKRDWSGVTVPNPQYHNLIRTTQAQADPVDLEMANLGIHPGPPQDRIGGVKLPPAMFDKYHATAAPLTREMLGNLVNMEGWHDLPPFVRDEMFRKTIAASRSTAAAQMQMMYPDIIKQGVDDKIAKITGAKKTKLEDAR